MTTEEKISFMMKQIGGSFKKSKSIVGYDSLPKKMKKYTFYIILPCQYSARYYEKGHFVISSIEIY